MVLGGLTAIALTLVIAFTAVELAAQVGDIRGGGQGAAPASSEDLAELAARLVAPPYPMPDGSTQTVTLQPASVWDIPNVPIAMHGQPSEDDSHVPIIFWGRGVRSGSYSGRMNTVDIAPTLGVLLGVSPLSLVDGRARTEALLR